MGTCGCRRWSRIRLAAGFGEQIDDGILAACVRAASSCDVFLYVGTSHRVAPASRLPELAAQAGAVCISVGLDPVDPDLNRGDLHIVATADAALGHLRTRKAGGSQAVVESVQ